MAGIAISRAKALAMTSRRMVNKIEEAIKKLSPAKRLRPSSKRQLPAASGFATDGTFADLGVPVNFGYIKQATCTFIPLKKAGSWISSAGIIIFF